MQGRLGSRGPGSSPHQTKMGSGGYIDIYIFLAPQGGQIWGMFNATSQRASAGLSPPCPGNLLIIPSALAFTVIHLPSSLTSPTWMEEPGERLPRKPEESNTRHVSGFFEDATGAGGSVPITLGFTNKYLLNKLSASKRVQLGRVAFCSFMGLRYWLLCSVTSVTWKARGPSWGER